MTQTVLITGITGFIAKHCALRFLEAGYAVRGTMRSIAKADAVRETLARHTDISRLSFVECDLMADAGWDEAMKGCDVVAHLASPFPMAQPDNEDDLIRPAVDGTMRVLTAAVRNGVKRFVQTSSVVAVMDGHDAGKTRFTEDDWTDVGAPHVNAYSKSKTLAEKAARDFVAANPDAIHYSSVNPGLVLGPALDHDIGTSANIVQMIMQGRYPRLPRVHIVCVDARDVAEAHLRAAQTDQASGGRYLAASDSLWFVEMARAIRDALGDDAKKVPSGEMPDFLVRLVGFFDKNTRAIVPDLGRERVIDNAQTRAALDMTFRPAREAAVATARSLVELGSIPS